MSETTDEHAWRRDRRAAVRRHHPDVGGDPAALQAALAEVDRRHGRGPSARASAGPARRVIVVRRSPLSQLVRGLRQVRRRIPPGWPGHRTGRDLD